MLTTLINSSLSYPRTKDSQTVTQSPRMKAFGDVVVVTAEEAADFGAYQCNITIGVSTMLCRVLLCYKDLINRVSLMHEGGGVRCILRGWGC